MNSYFLKYCENGELERAENYHKSIIKTGDPLSIYENFNRALYKCIEGVYIDFAKWLYQISKEIID